MTDHEATARQGELERINKELCSQIADMCLQLAELKAERDELQQVINEKSAFIGEQIHEIHQLQFDLERARGGPSKNEQWKKLVAERDAAFVAGLERAKELCARTCLDREVIQAEIAAHNQASPQNETTRR